MKSLNYWVLGTSLLAAACGGGGGGEDPACDEPGTACRWAGTGNRGFNTEHPDDVRLASDFYFPTDMTFGPDGRAYIADWNNHRIRRVETDDRVTVVMGTDYEGDGPPEMEDRLPVCNPAGALGTTVALNHPTDLKFGPDGKLYVAAWHNNKIRVIDTVTDIVTVLGGDSYGYGGDNGPVCLALFNQPKTLIFDTDGTLYTVDQRNVRIRAVTTDHNIKTMAGTGVKGNAGDGGLAVDAQFGFDTTATPKPSGGLAIVGRKLYVADSANNRIRRIDLDSGMIDCIAGLSSEAGYSGDGGPAMDAKFNYPSDLEIGPDGRLYIADRFNDAIRAIDLNTGIVETVAGGTHCDTFHGKCPDAAPALQMPLNEPYGLAFDATGNMYIADTHNSRILKVTR